VTRVLRDARGVVMMEFLIALFPVMLAFLGTAQFAFATVGKLLVRHAAVVGARAAVVVIEESIDVPGTPPDLYAGLPAGELELGEERDDPAETNESGLRSATSNASDSNSATSVMQSLMNTLDRGHSRMAQIRTAAYLPLMAASPNAIAEGLGFIVGAVDGEGHRDTLESAIGGAG
jgi:hypothetical protein